MGKYRHAARSNAIQLTLDFPDLPALSQEWITVKQAMACCQVSRRTIYAWIEKGLVRTSETAGGRTRLWHADLLIPEDLE
jgi:hypothetical protein